LLNNGHVFSTNKFIVQSKSNKTLHKESELRYNKTAIFIKNLANLFSKVLQDDIFKSQICLLQTMHIIVLQCEAQEDILIIVFFFDKN